MNGITYDAEQHRSTDAEGRDVPHVTHILSAVGLAFDFDGLAQLSSRTRATGPLSATAYSFQPSNDDRVMLLLPKMASPASDTWIFTWCPPPSHR